MLQSIIAYKLYCTRSVLVVIWQVGGKDSRLRDTVYVLGMYYSILHIKLCRSILPCTWEWDGSFMLTACRRPAGIVKYRKYCSKYM